MAVLSKMIIACAVSVASGLKMTEMNKRLSNQEMNKRLYLDQAYEARHEPPKSTLEFMCPDLFYLRPHLERELRMAEDKYAKNDRDFSEKGVKLREHLEEKEERVSEIEKKEAEVKELKLRLEQLKTDDAKIETKMETARYQAPRKTKSLTAPSHKSGKEEARAKSLPSKEHQQAHESRHEPKSTLEFMCPDFFKLRLLSNREQKEKRVSEIEKKEAEVKKLKLRLEELKTDDAKIETDMETARNLTCTWGGIKNALKGIQEAFQKVIVKGKGSESLDCMQGDIKKLREHLAVLKQEEQVKDKTTVKKIVKLVEELLSHWDSKSPYYQGNVVLSGVILSLHLQLYFQQHSQLYFGAEEQLLEEIHALNTDIKLWNKGELSQDQLFGNIYKLKYFSREARKLKKILSALNYEECYYSIRDKLHMEHFKCEPMEEHWHAMNKILLHARGRTPYPRTEMLDR